MSKAITQVLTGPDNCTHDIGRWMALAYSAVALGLQVLVVVRGAPFSIQDFGIGCGALAAGVGAMLKLKESTEPQPRAVPMTSDETQRLINRA